MKWLFKYQDKNRKIESIMFNDGKKLSVKLKERTFQGSDFDSLEILGEDQHNLHLFTLFQDALCDCKLECTIPIDIQDKDNLVKGNIIMNLELGKPIGNRGIDKEILKLTLEYKNYQISSIGTSGWFEDEIFSIENQLPEDVYIKSCINCAYSEYSPYGHGLFGNMLCFRNLKKKYLQIKTKSELLEIHDDYDQLVQETFICKEFKYKL